MEINVPSEEFCQHPRASVCLQAYNTMGLYLWMAVKMNLIHPLIDYKIRKQGLSYVPSLIKQCTQKAKTY